MLGCCTRRSTTQLCISQAERHDRVLVNSQKYDGTLHHISKGLIKWKKKTHYNKITPRFSIQLIGGMHIFGKQKGFTRAVG